MSVLKTRKNFRLTSSLVTTAEKLCKAKDVTLTNYIETLIRYDLRKRNLISKPKPTVRWTGGIEDMPLKVNSDPGFETITNN